MRSSILMMAIVCSTQGALAAWMPVAIGKAVPVLAGRGLALCAILTVGALVFVCLVAGTAAWSTRDERRRAAYDVLVVIADVIRAYWRRNEP